MLNISEQTLDNYKLVGDPLADAVIATLAARNALSGDIETQITRLVDDDRGALRDWQEVTQTVPDWVDWQQIDHGPQLFLQHVPLALASFVLSTLPQTYAPPSSARVLLHTGRLREDVLRRLYETATMVSAVLAPQGMRVGGAGHRAVLRVRLLHARVRHHVNHSGRWPNGELGQPINQLELGLTALGFSLQIVRGLLAFGIGLDADIQQSYQHLWRYANYLQGVTPNLQADSIEGEARIYNVLAPHLQRPDESSRLLVQALHEHLGWQAPFFLSSNALRAVSRHLLAPSLADAYQLPSQRSWHTVLQLLKGANSIASLRSRLPGLGALEGKLGEFYFHRLIAYGLSQKPADFSFKSAN